MNEQDLEQNPSEQSQQDMKLTITGIKPTSDGQGIAVSISPDAGRGKECIKMMAAHFMQMLDEEKAVNYLEMLLHDDKKRAVIVTIQRQEGKTPHELRQEAEADADRMADTLRRIEIWCQPACASCDKECTCVHCKIRKEITTTFEASK